MVKKKCIHHRGFDDCACNNEEPEDLGECIYENGIPPDNPQILCPHYEACK